MENLDNLPELYSLNLSDNMLEEISGLGMTYFCNFLKLKTTILKKIALNCRHCKLRETESEQMA